jgi:environmental stress-induced protein Ves
MLILPAADRIATPWKNGGGTTREVAAFPSGSSFEAFDWRVSLAEVAESGEFSQFPGVDRWLCVLDGRLRLEVEGQGAFELAPGDHLAFPGDAATRAELIDGPVLDLNVMSRRGKVNAEVAHVDGAALGGARQLVVAAGPARIGARELVRHDAALFAPDDPSVTAEGPLYVITFHGAP